jgi:hypothetical protein
MMSPRRHEKSIERVTKIYVAVFPVPVDQDRSVEVILAGYQNDPNIPNIAWIRATIETNTNAVADLVTLCDKIVAEQEGIDSYRLLKFDKNGIHVLSPDDFRTFAQKYTDEHWGSC